MKIRTCQLHTPFETDRTRSWEEHPRPQFRRDSYLMLCGEWELSVVQDMSVEALGAITVPFPPESRLSGLSREPKPCTYIYTKEFVLPASFSNTKVLLHFGAVDQMALVFVNDQFVGEHIGGYLPFSFEVQDYLVEGKNTLRVEATDRLDTELTYGKQRYQRGGMWYTPISGIWQPVWLESVPQQYIQTIRLTSTLDSVTIQTVGGKSNKTLCLQTEDGKLTYHYYGDSFVLKIDHPRVWSPEDPYLYSFTLSDGEDVIYSYFALRTVTIQKVGDTPYICLNNKPYYFHGLLDQGYFSDGIYLPATPEGYRYDILTAKKLGFNMLRKHIKIEPETFYYDCDRYGMIVFQDIVNSGTYRYFSDTVLPTVGVRRRFTYPASSRRRKHFETQAAETVSLLYNHPCVCYYTIFNEGWGQYDSDRIYRELKRLDPTRVWDATSGWFAKKESDVVSEHIYFRKFKCKKKHSKPLVLSEFGGYSCKIADHSFNLDKNYGYKTYHTTKSFENGLISLYRNEILPAFKNGLCATVLTQLSDVEDETNGLVTYDRQIVKVRELSMQALASELKTAFDKQVEKNNER